MDGVPPLGSSLHGRPPAAAPPATAVHEKTGVYRDVQLFDTHKMGQVLAGDIDLRLFLGRWHVGFAVTLQKPGGSLRGFQFFDRHGTAVHKIYLREESDEAAGASFVKRGTEEPKNRSASASKLLSHVIPNPVTSLRCRLLCPPPPAPPVQEGSFSRPKQKSSSPWKGEVSRSGGGVDKRR